MENGKFVLVVLVWFCLKADSLAPLDQDGVAVYETSGLSTRLIIFVVTVLGVYGPSELKPIYTSPMVYFGHFNLSLLFASPISICH